MADGALPLAKLPLLGELPRVSVVIPTYNEEGFIGACLTSLEEQTYPRDLIEVIIADGRSTDGTRDVVARHQAAGRLASLLLIDNPERSTAHGRNAAILLASAPVISALDAHAVAAPTYIEAAVEVLRRTGAAGVGGPWETAGSTGLQSAIAAAMSHPFGIGDARYRYSQRPAEVATVGFGTYRRECFDLLGGYDVTRDKGEDEHLNFRIRLAGGRLWLDPSIQVTYFARPTFLALVRQFHGYGRAKGRAMVDEPRLIRPHHVVPALAVLGGGLLAAASPASSRARALLRLLLLSYTAVGAYSAYETTLRRREEKLAPLAFLAFAAIHASYGLGSLRGIASTIRKRGSAGREPTNRASVTGDDGAPPPASLAALPPLPANPLVSVVVPALNEERYIGACLESLKVQTYPAELIEVLVTDGGSTDRTREIVDAHRVLPRLQLVDNPDRTANHGLRLGAELARGDVIIILGAHATVEPDFIEENVRALRETGAAAVGGPIYTVGGSRLGGAIAAALSHPFGVGDARFRTSTVADFVDTIAFAAYRRECFDVVGNFDVTREKRVDDQYNWRVRRAGGQLYLTPRIRSTYFARSDYAALARQYFGYGRAKGRALVEETSSIRARHVVPAGVVTAGAGLGLGSLVSGRARRLLGLSSVAYGAIAAYAALRATSRRGDIGLAPMTGLAFPVIHASYGTGTLLGAIEAFRSGAREG